MYDVFVLPKENNPTFVPNIEHFKILYPTPFSLYIFYENVLQFLPVFIVHFVKNEITLFLHLKFLLKFLNSTCLMMDDVKPKLVS